jgi:hypothetical protein
MTKVQYNKHQDKYLSLFEKFMDYVSLYNTNINIPKNAHLVFYDSDDAEFSKYTLSVIDRLVKQDTKNIVEVTKTGWKQRPWRVSKFLVV